MVAILGELNGIIYKEVIEQDYQDVLDLFMELIEDEPMSKSAGGYRKDCIDYPPVSMCNFMLDILRKGMCLMAVDKETNKPVGIRTQYTVERGQKEKKYSLQEMLKMYPKTWAYLMECCNKFWCAEKFFEENPDIDRVLCFFFVAIRPEYRGRSIATQLIKIAIEHTAKNPAAPSQAVQVYASNPFTRKIFSNFGFELVDEYEGLRDVDTGEPLFPGQSFTIHILRI